jgi:hypothetical protein
LLFLARYVNMVKIMPAPAKNSSKVDSEVIIFY